MPSQSKKQHQTLRLNFLTVCFLAFSGVSAVLISAPGATASVFALATALLLTRVVIALRPVPAWRFAAFGLPVAGVFAASIGGGGAFLLPPLAVLGAAVAIFNLIRRPWLALPLSVIALVVGVVVADRWQPEPPPFAGAFEIHLPGATGLRWDLDLHTNFFGNFDHAQRLTIDEKRWAVSRTPGVFRLVCLGTSQAIGPGLPRDQTWCAVLGRALEAQFPNTRVEAINASLYAGDDLMQWIYYDHILRRLRPDVLLVSWFGRIVPPHGSRNAARHIGQIVAQCADCDPATKHLSVRVGTANPLLRPLLAVYFDLRLFRNLLAATGGGLPANPKFLPQVVPDESSQPDPKQSEIVRRFIADQRESGHRLFFVPEAERSLDFAAPSYARQLEELAPGSVLDVRPALLGHAPETLFTDANHLTRLGHQLQGEFLAKALTARGVTPVSP